MMVGMIANLSMMMMTTMATNNDEDDDNDDDDDVTQNGPENISVTIENDDGDDC